MELIALAVAFALVFVPLFLATELAGRRPEAARLPRSQAVDAATAAERYLAAHPLAPSRTAAANDEHERIAA